jgi:hypothetical protein
LFDDVDVVVVVVVVVVIVVAVVVVVAAVVVVVVVISCCCCCYHDVQKIFIVVILAHHRPESCHTLPIYRYDSCDVMKRVRIVAFIVAKCMHAMLFSARAGSSAIVEISEKSRRL